MQDSVSAQRRAQQRLESIRGSEHLAIPQSLSSSLFVPAVDLGNSQTIAGCELSLRSMREKHRRQVTGMSRPQSRKSSRDLGLLLPFAPGFPVSTFGHQTGSIAGAGHKAKTDNLVLLYI